MKREGKSAKGTEVYAGKWASRQIRWFEAGKEKYEAGRETAKLQ